MACAGCYNRCEEHDEDGWVVNKCSDAEYRRATGANMCSGAREMGKNILNTNCELKSPSAKVDRCDLCGYVYIYS
ncbi:hypothetical protein RsoM2USA_398 [Ralstonia phage RsoM2USA]|nr:hypothetical protein RsoM2USA_398 [Ralstonia phage RsoM2USA]